MRARRLACRRYFFEIRRTWREIDPELSTFKVPRSKQNVALRLRKRDPGVEWPAVRCMENEITGYLPTL